MEKGTILPGPTHSQLCLRMEDIACTTNGDGLICGQMLTLRFAAPSTTGRKKEETMIPPKAPKTCERCGVTYIPTGTRQKYCKECRKAVQREWERKYEKKRREERKKPVKERPVQQPVLTIAQAVKEARERGMTYGQYISWRCS